MIDASKAAYLSVLILSNAKKIKKYKNPEQIRDWLIENPLNKKLNRLKRTNPQAFSIGTKSMN